MESRLKRMCSSARCNVLKERNINSRAEPPQMCRPHWFSYPVRERAPFIQQHTRLCQKKSVRKIDFVGICEKSNSCFRSSSHLALLLSLCKYDYCKIKGNLRRSTTLDFCNFPLPRLLLHLRSWPLSLLQPSEPIHSNRKTQKELIYLASRPLDRLHSIRRTTSARNFTSVSLLDTHS